MFIKRNNSKGLDLVFEEFFFWLWLAILSEGSYLLSLSLPRPVSRPSNCWPELQTKGQKLSPIQFLWRWWWCPQGVYRPPSFTWILQHPSPKMHHWKQSLPPSVHGKINFFYCNSCTKILNLPPYSSEIIIVSLACILCRSNETVSWIIGKFINILLYVRALIIIFFTDFSVFICIRWWYMNRCDNVSVIVK